MNRITFIKRLVLGTAAVPAVLAASKATKGTINSFKGYTGKETSIFREVWFDGQEGKINMQKLKDEIELIKPEDAPLYRSI